MNELIQNKIMKTYPNTDSKYDNEVARKDAKVGPIQGTNKAL